MKHDQPPPDVLISEDPINKPALSYIMSLLRILTLHFPLSALTSPPLFPLSSSQVTMVTHSSVCLLPGLVSM